MAALPDENGAEDANTMAVTTTPQDAAEMIIGQMSLTDLDRLQVKVADRRTVVLSGDQAPASYAPIDAPLAYDEVDHEMLDRQTPL